MCNLIVLKRVFVVVFLNMFIWFHSTIPPAISPPFFHRPLNNYKYILKIEYVEINSKGQ